MEGYLQKAFPMLHQAAGHGGKFRRMDAFVLHPFRRNFAFHGAAFVSEAGFAFGMMERRLKAEVYHSDGEGRAVGDSNCQVWIKQYQP